MWLPVLMAVASSDSKATSPGTDRVGTISCDYDVGIDHAYGDLGPYLTNINTTSACCAACKTNRKCVAWVLETDTAYCFLKSETSSSPCKGDSQPCTRPYANRISMKNCPSPPTPPAPPPPPTQHHWLPVQQLSIKYRNWTYYTGGLFGGFVVPPLAGNFSGQTLTDTAVVYLKTPEDQLPGKYRMTYLFYNGSKGNNGYEAALATSDNLLDWSFNRGGDNGIIYKRNPVPGSYDYGGVTLGGLLFSSANTTAPRTLQKTNGKYWALYGCYPSRSGYEAGDGGQGIASSDDGVVWDRVSDSTPMVAGSLSQKAPWESRVVYQPFLVQNNGTYYDFYNAAGINEYGKSAEESGFRTLSVSQELPGLNISANSSLWLENPASPVIPSGPSGAIDTNMASDPKVFWDAEQNVWVMFYFALGDGTHGHAGIAIAFSTDLIHWDKDDSLLYAAGGHPDGIDSDHAHKISLIYDSEGTGYLYYTAVGGKGRGIALLTSKPV